jgi:hypothetical protein
MKVDRSINFISDLTSENWRTVYAKYKLGINPNYKGNSKQNSGIVFCPYITSLDLSSMYPHVIKIYDETKIRCRTYKRYTPGS